ncbi:MAG: DUF6036 family nucleotidyltransferase [Kofleriaceae bacterium]
MNALEAACRLSERLDEAGIDYAIGGALALGVWGAPRATRDVDLSVFVDDRNLASVVDAFERAGVRFDHAAAISDVARIGFFRGVMGKVPIDTFISRHPHFWEMRARRRVVRTPDGHDLYFVTAEDLCVMKLVYGRDKDVTDLERLFAVRGLDVSYIRHWLARIAVGPDRLEVLDDLERRFPPK